MRLWIKAKPLFLPRVNKKMYTFAILADRYIEFKKLTNINTLCEKL